MLRLIATDLRHPAPRVFDQSLPVIPPTPVPASAPETSFSAQRAMEDLRVVAREPHPIGSAEQERVPDYILAQAEALGLPAEVQCSKVGSVRTAENVIVRVPGTANSARDVLITAHYDSVPVGPGAGDDFCPGVPTLLFPMSAHLQDRVRYGLLD